MAEYANNSQYAASISPSNVRDSIAKSRTAKSASRSKPENISLRASQDPQKLKEAFETSLKSKHERSSNFFKDTKINTCSSVIIQNGKAIAQPYHPKPAKNYADLILPSSETTSFTRDAYKPKPNLHVGMAQKPLEPYNPYSYRNRLPTTDVKMPFKNASTVELGDRGAIDKRHFVSTTRNTYGNFGKMDPITNTGILAERTKWHHHMQSKQFPLE